VCALAEKSGFFREEDIRHAQGIIASRATYHLHRFTLAMQNPRIDLNPKNSNSLFQISPNKGQMPITTK
jgi:hypothetical protein